MYKNRTEISSLQFFATFFLCRIFGLLTYINEPGSALSAGNGSMLFLPYFVFTLLFSLPVFLYVCVFRHSFPANPGSKAARVSCLLYGIFFLLQGALGAALLDRFVGETIFQNGGHPVLMFFFFVLVLFSSRNGIETAARTAPPLLFTMLLSFILITAATFSYFDAANLLPPAQTDFSGLLKNGAFAAMRTTEPVSLLFLFPKIKGNKKAGVTCTVFALGATASLLFTLIAGVTGAFGETQTFQLFTLTTLAELGTVERMDDILCAIWIFCAFLRTVFYFSLACTCFAKTFPHFSAPALRASLGAGSFGLYLLLLKNTFLRRWIEEQNGNVILSLLFVFLFPLFFLIAYRIKRLSGRKKA